MPYSWDMVRLPRLMGPVAACAASCVLCVVAPAQEAREPSSVHIAVSGVGGATSTLTISYPSDPGIERAEGDVAALAEASGWSISKPERAVIQEAVLYETDIKPAVTLDDEGRVPFFPFAYAFRRFTDIMFVFIGDAAGESGEFRDENRFLSAHWTRSGRVVTYEFRIKDPSFETAADVKLVERPADQPLPRSASAAPTAARRTAYLWLLLIVGALGTGVFVWGLTWWLLTLYAARNGDTKKGKRASGANQRTPAAPASRQAAETGPES